MNVGCVGSRDLSPEQILICESIGKYLASHGHTVVSGNAKGADQAFQRGAGDGAVILCLPWAKYELAARPKVTAAVYTEYGMEDWEVALKCHPAWARLSEAVQKLMVRNAAIVRLSEKIVAWSRLDARGKWTGGTSHTLRCAELLGKPIVDLSDPVVRARVLRQIER